MRSAVALRSLCEHRHAPLGLVCASGTPDVSVSAGSPCRTDYSIGKCLPVAPWFIVPVKEQAKFKRDLCSDWAVHPTTSRVTGGESALSILDANGILESIQVSQSHLTDKKTETQKSRFAQGHTAW